MSTEELARLLHNLIRVGTISGVDYDARKVRVKTGELETNWLKWLEERSGETTDWSPPNIGEQVLLLAPGGELSSAMVLGSIPSDSMPQPSNDKNKIVRKYPDGARVEYDHSTGAMKISGIKTLLVEAAEIITLKAKRIDLNP